jgi:hypothetical protein
MSKFGRELIASLKQAADHAKGRKVPGTRFATVATADVKTKSPPRKSEVPRFRKTKRRCAR